MKRLKYRMFLICCILFFFSQVYAIPVIAGYTTYLISFPIVYSLLFTVLFVFVFFRWIFIYINWILLLLIVLSIFLLVLIFGFFGVNDLKGFILLYDYILSVQILFKFIIFFLVIAFLFLLINSKLKYLRLTYFLYFLFLLGLLLLNFILFYIMHRVFILDKESKKYIELLSDKGNICGLYGIEKKKGNFEKTINSVIYTVEFKINKNRIIDEDLLKLIDNKQYYSCDLIVYCDSSKLNYLLNEKEILLQENSIDGGNINITFGGELGWYCSYCMDKILNSGK